MVNRRWWVPRTLSQKLVLYIVSTTCALLVGTIWVGYDSGRRALELQTSTEAFKQVRATALTMDAYVDRVATIVKSIEAYEKSRPHLDVTGTIEFFSSLLNTVTPEEAYGVYIAIEDSSGRVIAMPWVDRRSEPKPVTPPGQTRPLDMEWYRGAVSSAKLHVSEPFFDESGSRLLLVSVTKPVIDEGGKSLGVAGADLSLELIQAITAQLHFRPGTEYAGEQTFLVSRAGRIISHPDPKLQMTSASQGTPVDRIPSGERILEKPEGSVLVRDNGSLRHLYWSTAPLTGWRVVLDLPDSIIVAAARSLATRTAVAATISVLGMVIVVMVVANRVTEPVRRLTQVTQEVTAEHYDRVGQLDRAAKEPDELGQLARGFQTMVREVATRESSLRNAEEKLAHSERYFRSLIENTSDVVSIFDELGRVRYMSPSINRVLGFRPEQFVGLDGFLLLRSHDTDLSLTASSQEAQAAFRKLLKTPGATDQVELISRHLDGTPLILEATMHNMLEDPAVGGVVVNLRDFTARKKSESLEKEKEAAEAASKAKSAFLANMSHELRTPLNSIIGYSEMLIEEGEGDKSAEELADLDQILTSGKHLLELINSVLDLSKIEAGKMDLFLQTFDVKQTVKEVLKIAQPLADKNENRLVLKYDDRIATMYADVTKIRQTLLNLLSNACKFTNSGTITLSVEALPHGTMRFSISDTGIGMTKEQSSRLFQAFTQADASISEKFGGTGLGLAISQRFCQMMSGEITVQSQPGSGTTFFVTLPLRVEEKKSKEMAAASLNPVKEVRGTVLVIDDEAAVHDLVRRSLAKHGLHVIGASSGEQGILLARQAKPDAITLDAMMPDVDGWTVLKLLGEDEQLKKIPVVMLTILDEKARALAGGAKQFLRKPVNRDQLVQAILDLALKANQSL